MSSSIAWPTLAAWFCWWGVCCWFCGGTIMSDYFPLKEKSSAKIKMVQNTPLTTSACRVYAHGAHWTNLLNESGQFCEQCAIFALPNRSIHSQALPVQSDSPAQLALRRLVKNAYGISWLPGSPSHAHRLAHKRKRKIARTHDDDKASTGTLTPLTRLRLNTRTWYYFHRH